MYHKKSDRLLLYVLGCLCLVSLVPATNAVDYGLVDIFSHFLFQYALISLALMIVFALRKRALLAFLAGFLFVLNVSAIIDFQESIHAAVRPTGSFKVYSANININNRELSKLYLEIQEIAPEIVLLVEVSPDQDELLRPLMRSYPYCVQNISEDVLGAVLLSKFPLHDHHITKLSIHGNMLVEARMEIGQKSVMFYGLHAQRPRFGNHQERVSQLLNLARQINERSMPVILAGDFNATPFSPLFREAVRVSGLKDSREGFGWKPSWPTYMPLLWLPIDHILVSPEIQVHNRATGSFIGSDHYPVLADLSIN